MRADGAQYLLPDGLTPAAAAELLSQRLGAVSGGAARTARTFYDTFDGRLHARGLTLAHDAGRLSLRESVSATELAGAPAPERPARLLAADLTAGPLRDRLAPLIDVRALLPTVTIRGREQRMAVLDDEGKTVVRLTAEAAALAGGSRRALRSRLLVTGLRGYGDALARVRHALEHDAGLVPVAETLLDEAVVAAGGRPGGVSSALDVALAPDDRADVATAAVLTHLLATIQANLPGTLADVDTEFLHDLRVAVRRTRSVQRQLRPVFDPDTLAHWRAEFRWLQQVTGPTRDLDVSLLEFGAIEPLRAVLAERRAREQARMARRLRSARARRALEGWSVLIGDLDGAGPDAGRPIAEAAGERVGRVYRRMVRMGRAIGDDSPPEALHDLRKKGKELRYLLELFAGALPADVTKPMVRSLKQLQDTLGRFQDHEVQAELLRELRDDVAVRDGGPAALMAMGALVEDLVRGQAAARAEFAERFARFADEERRRLVEETFG
jgi:CHAD domain-containing protein